MTIMLGFLVLKQRLCFVSANDTRDRMESMFLSKLSFGLQ